MARQARFAVTLSAASAQQVTVDYATQAGTAVEGEDYTPVSGTLVFAPGETSKDIVVPVRTGDETTTESFTLLLSAPVGANVVNAQGECVIPAVGGNGSDTLPNLILDLFNDDPGSLLNTTTMDSGGQWSTRAFDSDIVSNLVVDGDRVDSGVYLDGVDGSDAIALSPYSGQRESYFLEFDFTLPQDPVPGDSWDLYCGLTDAGVHNSILTDLYWSGTDLELYCYSEGPDSTPDVVDITPPTLNPAGQINTVRLEVYSDHWRVLLNGVEQGTVQMAMALYDPAVRMEMINYNTTAVPYKVNRVRVAETPLRVPQQLFAGNLDYTIPAVTWLDRFDGANGTNLIDHVPDIGPQAQPGDSNPLLLDGAGGLQVVNGTGMATVGQMFNYRDFAFHMVFRINTLPTLDGVTTLEFYTGVEWITLTCNSDGTVGFAIPQFGAADNVTLTVGAEHTFDWLDTTRITQLTIDGAVVFTRDRAARDGFSTNQNAALQLANPDAYPVFTVLECQITEYQDTPAV